MYNREKDWLDFIEEFNKETLMGVHIELVARYTDHSYYYYFSLFFRIYKLWAKKYNSGRLCPFEKFVENVREHIVEYTVVQYGDSPDDQLEKWSVETCDTQVQKYLNRIDTNVREGQGERDLFKAAHLTQVSWMKSRR